MHPSEVESWLTTLPEHPAGGWEWGTVESTHEGRRAIIPVWKDALYIENRRPACTAEQLQQMADVLDSCLLTPYVLDLIDMQSEVRMDAITQVDGVIVAELTLKYTRAGATKEEALWQAARDYARVEDAALTALDPDWRNKLVSCVGKHFVLSNRLLESHPAPFSINYGWFALGAPSRSVTGLKLWQPPGAGHVGYWQIDNSQVERLMYGTTLVGAIDGEVLQPLPTIQIAQDPDLYHLVSHELLKLDRQPFVEFVDQVELADGTIFERTVG